MFQLSQLQGYNEQDENYPNDYRYSKSCPNSGTNNVENAGRKTWSAPNMDPFGLSENHQLDTERKPRRSRGELDNPLQRNPSHKSQTQKGYQPSFGTNIERRAGNSRRYMKELEEQMADQKRRKEQEDKEKETDWWEKRKPLVPEFKVPHPNQVLLIIYIFILNCILY